jgi:ribosomal protein S18 acetylase RimI-like enzyme
VIRQSTNHKALKIEKVASSQLNKLQEISRQTFHETFASQNSEEDMAKYLDEGLSLQNLNRELDSTSSAFYFAYIDDQIAGYLKVNWGDSQTENHDKDAFEIERIYILKSFQGSGVGQSLFDFSLKLAKDRGANYVWLGVWEFNHKARSFYKKNGFTEFGKHIFTLGQDKQTDVLMKHQSK